MTTLTEMLNLAEALGSSAESIRKQFDAMERQVNAIRTEFLNRMMPVSTRFMHQKAELETVIEKNPQHFRQPRTIEVNGVKFGMKAAKGKIVINDPEATLEKVNILLKDKKEFLVEKKETLLKNGLAQLSELEMKAIGVSREEDNPDAVFIQIKSVDKDIPVLRKMIEENKEKRTDEKLKLAS